ncbi:MAG: DUF1905 domain-containing protein [Flavobacteriales bacterium]|nr:DUF1905 domain-containing protein [Flavobacteriales bacterium]
MKSYQFKAEVDLLDSALWQYYFEVPQVIADELIANNHKRVFCTINNEIEFQCALMPKGEGKYFININKERRKQLLASQFTELNIELKPDESEYGLPMPEELQELLYQDPDGDKIFQALTKGKQRTLLHLIGKPKNIETRLKKALIVVEYLKTVNGKLDFKELNQAFKNNNY